VITEALVAMVRVVELFPSILTIKLTTIIFAWFIFLQNEVLGRTFNTHIPSDFSKKDSAITA
jgi:hypothetical protein